jgi:hypothetical protein
MHRIIETILSEMNAHGNSFFVFPTEIAVSRWVDLVLEASGCGTLAMERFITWDAFMQELLGARQQDKEPIPPGLRKLWVSRLLEEHAAQVRNQGVPCFSSLVPPEYAHTAGSFGPWLTAMLPELGRWFEKKTGIPLGQHTGGPLPIGFDGLDEDLYRLMIRYRQFLDEHRCFEPAWETHTLDTKEKRYVIFFPEILPEDYQEWLKQTPGLRLVPIPDRASENKQPQTFFYTNSQSELTEVALFIRSLVENHGVPWESIAVSVPDMEHYEPYLRRELANRNIPVVSTRGKPVAAYPGGQLFPAIQSCVSSRFSFDAMANLLLNTHLPWKDPEAIAQLMDFGIKNNCMCSWEEEPGLVIDVWEDAFAARSASWEERARLWYVGLKKAILALYNAPSFGEVVRQYSMFREHFFAMESCLPETNTLLVRGMAELYGLAALETSFPDVSVSHPFVFFVEHLKETWYQVRESGSGVRVFPYRSAAAAPFAWHIVIGATQGDLNTVFSGLAFLSAGKRAQLGIKDQDVSGPFINLYTVNGLNGTAFFCAQQTFSGFALPHHGLKGPAKPKIRYGEPGRSSEARFVPDLFREEQWFYHAQQYPQDRAPFPQRLHQVQKAGFDAWRARRSQPRKPGTPETMQRPTIHQVIQERYGQVLHDGSRVLRVSSSALEPYYQCALQWLFDQVLGLKRIRMETNLMAENIRGIVYHQVLEGFFKQVKIQGGVLAPLVQGKLSDLYRHMLEQSVTQVFSCYRSGTSREEVSPLTCRLLQAQQRVVQDQIAGFLTSFLRYFTGFRVLESEQKLSYHAEKDQYLLTGIIDCLLEDLEHTGLIVDFKLINTPRRAPCIGKGAQGLENFQLPLYLTLAEKNKSPPIHRALFFSILHPKPQVIFGVIQDQTVLAGKKVPYRQGDRIERTTAHEDSFHLILREFEDKAGRYAAEALSGNFSTYRTSESRCFACGWHTLCRTGYAVAGTRCPIIQGPSQDHEETNGGTDERLT